MAKELNYQTTSNKRTTEPLSELRYRPTTALFLTFAIGVICLFVRKNLGIFFIAVAVAGFYFFPNTLVLEVYEDGICFYNPFKNEESLFIHKENVAEWDIGEDHKIHIKTRDGSVFAQICPRFYKATEILSKYYPDQKAPSPLSKLRK